MPITPGSIAFRLEGYNAPGSTCPAPDEIGLGLQQGQDVVGVLPSSTPDPRFRGHLNVAITDDGVVLSGPFVHGPRGDRFLYLSWIHLKGRQTMSRIKLKLADIDPELILRASEEEGAVLVGYVSITNSQGKPASGTVKPPLIRWEVCAK